MRGFEPDITTRAEEWARQPAREGQLPIMNFRPGVLPPSVGDRYLPQPPRLFSCDQLLPYYLTVHCVCGRVTEASGTTAAKLIAKGERLPIGHLLTLLTCGTCGKKPSKLEIAACPMRCIRSSSQTDQDGVNFPIKEYRSIIARYVRLNGPASCICSGKISLCWP